MPATTATPHATSMRSRKDPRKNLLTASSASTPGRIGRQCTNLRFRSGLDPERALDAVLAQVDQVAAQDAGLRLAAGVQAERGTDAHVARRLVDVAVDAERRAVALDRRADGR